MEPEGGRSVRGGTAGAEHSLQAAEVARIRDLRARLLHPAAGLRGAASEHWHRST